MMIAILSSFETPRFPLFSNERQNYLLQVQFVRLLLLVLPRWNHKKPPCCVASLPAKTGTGPVIVMMMCNYRHSVDGAMLEAIIRPEERLLYFSGFFFAQLHHNHNFRDISVRRPTIKNFNALWQRPESEQESRSVDTTGL